MTGDMMFTNKVILLSTNFFVHYPFFSPASEREREPAELRARGGTTRAEQSRFLSHCRVDVVMFFGRNGVTFTSTGPSCAVPVPGALEDPGSPGPLA